MAQDIVSGLFGVSPDELNAQRRARSEAQAAAMAGADPYARANYLTQMGASGLTGGALRALGVEDQQMKEAQQRQQMLSQIDMSTPDGILKAAEIASERGDVQTQLRLQQLANQRQEELVNEQFKMAEVEKMRRQQQQPQERADVPSSYREWMLARQNGSKLTYEQWMKKGETADVSADGERIDFSKPQGRMYLKQHSEDLQQLRSAKSIAEDAKKSADELLKKDNLSSLFGAGYSGVLTSKANPDAVTKLNHLKSIMKASGMQQLKAASGQSIGAMQVAEWPIVEGMIDSLDTTMSEAEAEKTIKAIKDRIGGITKSIHETYNDTWSRFPQLHKEIKLDEEAQKGSGLPEGSKLVGKTPDGKDVYQSPDGRKWVQ